MMSKRFFVISLIAIGLLLNCFNFVVNADAGVLEDFTTYTEVDNANDDITVVSAVQVDGNTMTRTDTAYLYKDFGVNHFDDFEHLHEAKPISSIKDSSYVGVWGMSNHIGDINTWLANGGGITLLIYRFTSDYPRFMLNERGGDADITNVDQAWNKQYYLVTERIDTTLTCKIYNDSAYTNLVDTLTIEVNTQPYRYLFPLASYDTAGAGFSITVESWNLDIQEAIPPPTPKQYLRMTDSYPVNNSVDVCPCNDYMSIELETNGTNNMNVSFYQSVGNALDFHGVNNYYNVTNGTYSFCMCDSLFIPAYITEHVNSTQIVSSAGIWYNVSFNSTHEHEQKDILHNDSINNDSFTIVYSGLYKIGYRLSFEDVNPSPSSEAYARLICNGNEIHGSLQSETMVNKNNVSSVAGTVIQYFYSGETVKVQYTSDSTNVKLSTHALYGAVHSSATIYINKVITDNQMPMRYNETYYWYVNVSEFGNSSNYNVSDVYVFTTATASECDALTFEYADEVFLSSAFSLTTESLILLIWMFFIILGEWKADWVYKILQLPIGLTYGVTLLGSDMYLGLGVIFASIYILAIAYWQSRKKEGET